MSIEIKKTGKNTYYRKDGNKMGIRKEKQEMINISIKHFEKDLEERHNSLLPTGWCGINKMLSGGIKRGEMAVMSACCAIPGDEYKNNMALAAVRHVDRSKVVMIGMEHKIEYTTDKIVEEFKHHNIIHNPIEKIKDGTKRVNMFYSGDRPNTVMIDGVPYNPMDEFDRPWMYNNNEGVIKLLSEPKYPELNNLRGKLDSIKNQGLSSVMFDVKKPYYKEVGIGEGEMNQSKSLGDIKLINNDYGTVKMFNTETFLDTYFEYFHYEHINTESLVKVIDNILSKDNKEVLVIEKEDDDTYFSKTDNSYKSVIVDTTNLLIQPEEAITTESYTTPQESLLRLLESIKGKEEFLLTYIPIGAMDVVQGIITKKEKYSGTM